MVMLQIIDISDSFLYDQSKAKNEFLSLINATVSHEMRNPLNSISAENLHKKELLK
jgi:signal transduction histidine kinase